MKEILTSRILGNYVERKFTEIYNSKAFINLNRYRNCSLHRRQICIRTQETKTKHTEGYQVNSTKDTETIRIICDNPYDINPKFIQNRRLPDYLDNTQKKIINNIKNIIQNLP